MTTPARRGPGRPTTGRTSAVLVRLTPEQRAAVDAAADLAGTSAPTYVRDVAVATAVAADPWQLDPAAAARVVAAMDAEAGPTPAMIALFTERDELITDHQATIRRGNELIAWVAEHAHRDELSADAEIAALRAERDALIVRALAAEAELDVLNVLAGGAL